MVALRKLVSLALITTAGVLSSWAAARACSADIAPGVLDRIDVLRQQHFAPHGLTTDAVEPGERLLRAFLIKRQQTLIYQAPKEVGR